MLRLKIELNLLLNSSTGEYVAQFKFTLLLLPSQTLRLNSFQLPYVSSEFDISNNAELQAILAMSTKRSKKNKKKKAKTGEAQAPAEQAPAE